MPLTRKKWRKPIPPAGMYSFAGKARMYIEATLKLGFSIP